MTKRPCAYSGLVGIVVEKMPEKELIQETSHEAWQDVIRYYAGERNPGVCSVFWDLGDLIPFSRIHVLGENRHYPPLLKVEEGLFVPSIPLCTGESPEEADLTEDICRQAAMREILLQSQDNLNGKKKDHYFMMSPYSEGCCKFKAGTVEARIDEIKEILRYGL